LLDAIDSIKNMNLGDNCRKKVIELFDKNRNFQKYIELYKELK